MNKSDYLRDDAVSDFLDWAEPLAAGKRGLSKSWRSRGYDFRCESLPEAYHRYHWPGKIKQDNGSEVRVSNFEETARLFEEWQQAMLQIMNRDATGIDDRKRFVRIAERIREWGGIRKHQDLRNLGDNAYDILRENARKLDPERADTGALRGFKHMGSGYSKVYAMMVPSLPIYDSRVACALASLILIYSKARLLPAVPKTLELGIPQAQGKQGRRNPSALPYQFPNTGDASKYGSLYAISNLKAAWLIGELAYRVAPFANLPNHRPGLALQSALFMVGYEPFDERALT